MTEPAVLDVRWLEPPEPFERILAALDELAPGGALRVLIHREPQPLFRWLRRDGIHFTHHYNEEGWFEILISK